MSFSRHGQIYRCAGKAKAGPTDAGGPAHLSDESAAGYSLAGRSPPEPASASPAEIHAE